MRHSASRTRRPARLHGQPERQRDHRGHRRPTRRRSAGSASPSSRRTSTSSSRSRSTAAAGCVEPTPETIASGEYPIARDLYIYVNAAKLAENPALEAFVDFYVSEGLTTLVGAGEGQVPYVPLSEEDVAATQAVWEAKETGTRDGGE